MLNQGFTETDVCDESTRAINTGPQATQRKMVLIKREATKEPLSIEEPVSAKENVSVEEPVTNKEPESTKEPVSAKENESTEETVSTKEPVSTTEPLTSKEPLSTEEPVATAENMASCKATATDGTMATKDNWQEVLRTNRTEIHRLISLDSGLEGELRKIELFTTREHRNIWGQKKTVEKVSKLLETLEKKTFDTFWKFLKALEATGQSRVVTDALSTVQTFSQVVAQDGPGVGTTVTDSAESYCLSFLKKKCLDRNWNDIVDDLSTDEEFFGKLREKEIFTDMRLKCLQDNCLESSRNEELLRYLERGSEKQYDAFCEVLKDANQKHIVEQYLMPFKGKNSVLFVNKVSEKARFSVAPIKTVKPTESVQASVNCKPPNPLSPRSAEMLSKLFPNFRFTAGSEEFLKEVRNNVNRKTVYKCDTGRAVIINNEHFSKFGWREGANDDQDALEFLFTVLQFDVKIFSNLTATEMIYVLKEESKSPDNANHDMLVIFLLSHGISGQIYGRDEEPVFVHEILSLFDGKNCASLVNKPKLFFIQACQGELKTEGVVQSDSPSPSMTPHQQLKKAAADEKLDRLVMSDDPQLSLCLPQVQSDATPQENVHEKADMALAYATVDGFVAYRRTDSGSLFVRCLLDVFSRNAHKDDLSSMLTEVFNKLHEEHVPGGRTTYRQIGEKRDTLRRKVYLIPRQVSNPEPAKC